MISRLLLVGLVGVLGVSLPDGAGWGKGLPRAPTEVAIARPTPRTAVAFEPIVIVEDAFNRLADELNRRSEGLDLPTAPIVKPRTAAREEFVPSPAGDTVELKLMAELWRAADEAEARKTANDGQIDELFAENRVWSEPAAEPAPAPVVPSAIDELFAENRVWSEPAAEPAPVAATAPAPESRPSFEPIAAVETASDMADALNRAADGQSIEPAADRSIVTAIRLTRTAALAWMSVLTKATSGPALSR